MRSSSTPLPFVAFLMAVLAIKVPGGDGCRTGGARPVRCFVPDLLGPPGSAVGSLGDAPGTGTDPGAPQSSSFRAAEVGWRAAAERLEVDLDALHAAALGEHAGLGLDRWSPRTSPSSARACRRGRAAPGSGAAARPRRSRRPASPPPPPPARRRRGRAGRPARGRSGTRAARARRSSRSACDPRREQLLELGLHAVLREAGVVAEVERVSSKSTSCSSIVSCSPLGLVTMIVPSRSCDRARRVHPVQRLVGLGVGVDRDRAVGLEEQQPRAPAAGGRRDGRRTRPSTRRRRRRIARVVARSAIATHRRAGGGLRCRRSP